MKLKQIFNDWAQSVEGRYTTRQWQLSKWEWVNGIEWPEEKCAAMLRTIHDGLELHPKSCVVDLGCGGGWILERLKAFSKEIYGLDISIKMLNHARLREPRDIFVCGELKNLPFKPESVDRALAYFVFINITDDDYVYQSIREIMRILKKGGRALIGQLPDRTGAKQYDAAKAQYLEYCRATYKIGEAHARSHVPPLRLFERGAFADFLKKENIAFEIRDSFNPFFFPNQPETVNWRFDLILKK